jgi:hypothetical protein
MCMQEEEGKTPEEDKGTEESEKVKDVFCLSLYISHRFQRRLEVLIYFGLDIFFTCSLTLEGRYKDNKQALFEQRRG